MSSDRESEYSQTIDPSESRAQAASDEAAYESSKNDQAERDFTLYCPEPESIPQTTSPYHLKRDWSSAILACILVGAIVVIGFVAEKNLNFWLPSKSDPAAGVVVEETAPVPRATPAYPTVYVKESTDPSQAPSPLPPAGTK